MNTGLLRKESIILDMDTEKKDEVITSLAKTLEKEGVVTNFEGFLKDIYIRENMDNTALGFGVAIPHGKSEWINEARLAFARLKKEIDWGEEDEFVKYVFLIAVPTGEASKHIEVLAGLSKKILDDKFRKELETANIERVLDLINS